MPRKSHTEKAYLLKVIDFGNDVVACYLINHAIYEWFNYAHGTTINEHNNIIDTFMPENVRKLAWVYEDMETNQTKVPVSDTYRPILSKDIKHSRVNIYVNALIAFETSRIKECYGVEDITFKDLGLSITSNNNVESITQASFPNTETLLEELYGKGIGVHGTVKFRFTTDLFV